jgi:hypothetical protein
MADVLFVAAMIAFFMLAVVFVRACERIIGPDLEAEAPADRAADQPEDGRPEPDRNVA